MHHPLDRHPGTTSSDAAAAAGISYRQLDYWTRSDVCAPTRTAVGSGTPRRWSRHDVARLTVVGHLARIGVGHDGMRAAWAALAALPLDWWPDRTVMVSADGRAGVDYLDPAAECYVVVDLGACVPDPVRVLELVR